MRVLLVCFALFSATVGLLPLFDYYENCPACERCVVVSIPDGDSHAFCTDAAELVHLSCAEAVAADEISLSGLHCPGSVKSASSRSVGLVVLLGMFLVVVGVARFMLL